ncbi:NAD-dependent epimerase/dehydratase family protein [Oerskovia paurometabola]|uniref:NAD-dependent epimerase/dehydratase family protein n=1 Tax=Oerskovia paurometabola TaxID=162170 RepID=UPI00343ED6B0
MKVWVVGAGGLLGAAVARHVDPGRSFTASRIPWRDPEESLATLRAELERFLRWLPDEEWAVVWAAGAGVVMSSPEQLAVEEHVLLEFARSVAAIGAPNGVFWFASSASVFGPSRSATWTEDDPARPAGPYPLAKHRQELALTTIFERAGRAKLVISRISTLYGPGQRIDKPQGLVTKICFEAVTMGVVSIVVPLESMRDYLYSDDAARLVHASLRSALRGTETVRLNVLSNGHPTSVAELIRHVQAVVHRRTWILQVPPSVGSLHATMLVVKSKDRELGAVRRTPLVVGVDAVARDVLVRISRGRGV